MLPLPIATQYARLDACTKQTLSCRLQAPFMAMSFMALKITDLGLFDVGRFGFVGVRLV